MRAVRSRFFHQLMVAALPRSSRLVIHLPFLLLVIQARGQISFLTPPSYPGLASFAADFNGDGKPDLLNNDGSLQLNNGDGTFRAGTSIGGTPLAVGDFNADGKLDVLEEGVGTWCLMLTLQ
jgi:FG-GAP-like repeat